MLAALSDLQGRTKSGNYYSLTGLSVREVNQIALVINDEIQHTKMDMGSQEPDKTNVEWLERMYNKFLDELPVSVSLPYADYEIITQVLEDHLHDVRKETSKESLEFYKVEKLCDVFKLPDGRLHDGISEIQLTMERDDFSYIYWILETLLEDEEDDPDDWDLLLRHAYALLGVYDRHKS